MVGSIIPPQFSVVPAWAHSDVTKDNAQVDYMEIKIVLKVAI